MVVSVPDFVKQSLNHWAIVDETTGLGGLLLQQRVWNKPLSRLGVLEVLLLGIEVGSEGMLGRKILPLALFAWIVLPILLV